MLDVNAANDATTGRYREDYREDSYCGVFLVKELTTLQHCKYPVQNILRHLRAHHQYQLQIA